MAKHNSTIVSKILQPILLKMGFSENSKSWYRFREPFIDCVDIQIRSDNAAFCINMGEHLTFLNHIRIKPFDVAQLESLDCEFRGRLSLDGNVDQWWALKDAAWEFQEISSDLPEIFGKFFGVYQNFPSLFTSFEKADIDSESMRGLMPMKTKIKRILFMAHLFEHLDNSKKAISWAKFGLKNAGFAVDPKAECRRIIRKYQK